MAVPKVLVVEDDNVILGIEKWRLSNLGYEICGSAASGAEAIECLDHMQPDIVLMDITLKGAMDGIETAAQIKKKFNIPVIFVSSHTDEEIISVPEQSTLTVLSKNPLMTIPYESRLTGIKKIRFTTPEKRIKAWASR